MKQDLFVREYCIDFNGTRAAIAAGYSKNSAAEAAYEVLRNPHVAERIEKYKARISSKVDLTVADVVRSITSVLNADPRELSETKIGCCRHCWGAYFLREEKPQEFRDRYAAHLVSEAYLKRGEEFNSMGGDGYRRTRTPNPECPECEGAGVQYTVYKDTSELSSDAVQLYMGVEQTANGIKVLTRSKDKAVEQAAKYLGMNKETVLTNTAPSGLTHFYPPGDDGSDK